MRRAASQLAHLEEAGGRRYLESRVHVQSTGANTKIVKPAAKTRSTKLLDLESPPLGAVVDRQMVEDNDAVGKTMQLHVAVGRRTIVEKQRGTVSSSEELL